MGVVNKKERRRNEEKTGLGAVLEGTNGSHELLGHFRGRKSRAVGRLLRRPEGQENCKGLGDGSEPERRKTILLDRATEHGLHSASHSGAIRRPGQSD